ncbi:MAG: YIP1 family protein [Amaricoccus sp.]
MWRHLVLDTLLHPRAAARQVLALSFSPGQLVEAAIVVTCVGMILGYAAVATSPDAIEISVPVLDYPLLGAVAQLAIMAVMAFLTVRIGRLFGGRGNLNGAIALVIWLNAMMVLIQVVQLVALAIVPPVAAVIAIATLIWIFWAYANFVAELHGFGNSFIVLGAVVLTAIVLFFGMAMLFAILGITPQGAS